MTTPLIEAIALKLQSRLYLDGEDLVPGFVEDAMGILTAITEAGYAVVPVEPTPGMAKIGVFVAGTGAVIPAYEAMVRAYSSMISAAQGDGA